MVGLGVMRGRSSSSTPSKDGMRSRTQPASPSMILVVFQVIGIFASAQFGWSDSAQRTLNVFNVANIDVNLFASECALDSFHVKYAVSVGLPLLVLLLVLISLALFKAVGLFGLRETRMRTLVDSVLFSVAPLVYIPMANAVFVMFDCSRLPNGDWVLDVDPGVACFDSTWWSVAWLGAVALLGFVIGVPVYFLFCIVRRRHKLMTPATYARYGALYKLYRIPYYWGGVADLGKRLAIVVAAVFVSDHVLAQIGLLLAVFLASAFVVNRTAPYYYPLYNELDFRLTLILIVLLLLGGASHSERNTAGGSDTVILVGVVLVLVALAVVAVHAVAVDVLQIVQTRNQRYSAARDRGARVAAFLEREMGDLDPEHASQAADLVATLQETDGQGQRLESAVEMVDVPQP